ncbi:glycerate kinase, partial [Salmonella enterica subsp. enterica serovar Poona]
PAAHLQARHAVSSQMYTICTLEDALKNASENVRMTARNVAATLKAGQQLR